VITDGDQVKVYTTYATDPAAVLDQAGFSLGEEDTYTTQAGDGVSEITVQRIQNITIDYCGEQLQVSSYGETLEMLLNRLGLPAGGDYTVSEPLTAETYDGMNITVNSVIRMEQSYTEDIPYEVIECEAPNLPLGERRVIVKGVTGQLTKTANVVYVNSVESEHTVVSETVTQQPVNEVVSVGTGTAVGQGNMPAIGDGVIVTADGEVLTYSRKAEFRTTAYSHLDSGCDMITATGTTVRVGSVAVDPKLVPYGTRMFVICNDGSYVYGIATAEDCGGGIKGNQLDLYMPTRAECFEYGKRRCTVYFLD
jgi:3D (Asp-Asp-Asp) domain-containing protein